MQRGALCISIDVELAWGVWDKPDPTTLGLVRTKERDIVQRLLALLQRYEVAATWAIVSQLLQRGRDHTIARGEDALWYAPEMVEAIRTARPAHEIGSHSFRHPYFSMLDATTARGELAEARRVHDAHGLEFRSFVYPRNLVAHGEALQEHGIAVFRSVDAGLLEMAGRLHPAARKVLNLGTKLLPVTPPTVWPRRHESGLIELQSSLLLMARNGARKLIQPTLLHANARRGLESAQARRGLFHLWFHPSNFYYDTDTQFQVFEAILSDAARLRDAGTLDVRTMGSFAN
jgi:peptidoglycan/xylan/chitin deacetylase (PgdA/CDA1 family)